MLYRESNMQNSPEINPRALNFENQGLMIDLHYMINENFSIGAGFGISKGNSPFFNNRRQLSDPIMFNDHRNIW